MTRDSLYDSESGQASVYLYKRDKESAAEILQPLISQDPRHFRSAFYHIKPLFCSYILSSVHAMLHM